jgi:plastocyanin
MKHILFLCTAVVVFLLMAGCIQTVQQKGQPAVTATAVPAGTPTAAPAITTTASVSDNTIVIQNMAYNPAQITVKAGSIVRWVNKDTVPHSVVFTDPAIPSSGILAPGQAYASVILNKAGIYNYSCSIHPQMHGSIVVTQ